MPFSCALPLVADAQTHQCLMACLEVQRPGKLFVQTAAGPPGSRKAFGQWMSESARLAGLEAGCTAHGLRKARAAAVAEAGAPASQLGAWIGDVSLSMAAHYTRAADRRAILAGPEQDRNPGNRTIEFPEERGEWPDIKDLGRRWRTR